MPDTVLAAKCIMMFGFVEVKSSLNLLDFDKSNFFLSSFKITKFFFFF